MIGLLTFHLRNRHDVIVAGGLEYRPPRFDQVRLVDAGGFVAIGAHVEDYLGVAERARPVGRRVRAQHLLLDECVAVVLDAGRQPVVLLVQCFLLQVR